MKHAPPVKLCFSSTSDVQGLYYDDCQAVVCRASGASRAAAFEHRMLRLDGRRGAAAGAGGEEPERRGADRCAHNDYTLATASARVELMTQPPPEKGTFYARDEFGPRVDPLRVDALLAGRWAFFSLWRSVGRRPLERFPLALCDAATMRLRDLEVTEVQHVDRIGERYLARYSPSNRWFYFPNVSREEALLQKCWDSRGRDFLDPRVRLGALGQAYGRELTVPATFSLRALLGDLVETPVLYPEDQGVVEVRLVAFFE